jgi:two-component system OmpR family response regulator
MSTPPLRRIALVDDQREIRLIVELALGKIGRFELRAFDSGEQALLKIPAFNPELLLLDMVMPGLDGLATLSGLRERGVLAPAIFFTARFTAADISHYQEAGALGVIAKPFDPFKLAGQIRALWDEQPR